MAGNILALKKSAVKPPPPLVGGGFDMGSAMQNPESGQLAPQLEWCRVGPSEDFREVCISMILQLKAEQKGKIKNAYHREGIGKQCPVLAKHVGNCNFR